MGKRSNFVRVARDFYPTPLEAVLPLLPHLTRGTRFAEPCAGDGALIDHLTRHGHTCSYACDIEPRRAGIDTEDATALLYGGIATCFITNPPWRRDLLHPMIVNLSDQRPTWLLFDADWQHTVQSIPYLPRLTRIVSVGRVKWIPGSKHTGKDNCCWYKFDLPSLGSSAVFSGRTAKASLLANDNTTQLKEAA